MGAIESTGQSTEFTISLPADKPLAHIDVPILAFSPDGRTIAFVAENPESKRPVISPAVEDRGSRLLKRRAHAAASAGP